MHHKQLVISILTDRSSWMNQYDQDLVAKMKMAGHQVNMVSNCDALVKGDIAFLLSCFEIVRAEHLNRNTHNIVVHASALPDGKGWSPATWQILEGKDTIPLTLFEATENVDAGSVYLRDSIQLSGYELISDWQEILGRKIVEMCMTFVNQLSRGEVVAEKQVGPESFYRRRRPEDSELDIDKPIADQFNLLRVVDNEKYPAYFVKDGRRYILKIYQEK